MIKKLSILFLSILLLQLPCFSYGHQYPIDKELDACQVENEGDAGAAMCVIKATEKWKKAVNEEYEKTLKILPKSKKQSFIDAQKFWRAFIEKDFKSFKTTNSIIDSCEARAIDVGLKMHYYRSRYIMLNLHYYNATR